MGTGSPAARSKGGETGYVGAPPAVGAGCNGIVGGGLANPVHAASPHGVLLASCARNKIHPHRHQGVHQSLVCPRQGTSHVAEGPPGPKQHDAVGVAGATPAPVGGEGGGAAGTTGLRAVAWWDIQFSPTPLFLSVTTQLHAARALHTPFPFTCTRGWTSGHCLLVTAPSAQHNTTQHNTTQHNTTQHNTTQHNTTQHNTTQHNTTQHNTTQHSTARHNTTQRNTTRHNTTQHNTTQHNTTQHNTTQVNTTQHNTTQHNTTQHNTTQHNTTQHNTTQHNSTQHNTTQHNTTHHNTTQHNTTQNTATGYNTCTAWPQTPRRC